jgi:hypothetical protein
MVRGGSLVIMRFIGQRSRSQIQKIERKKLIFFSFPHDILRTKCRIYMKLGTHVPDGERRNPIDNEVCRTKVKVTTSKNRTKI